MAESVVFNALRMVHHKKDAPLMKKRTVYQREKYTSEAEHQDGSVFKKALETQFLTKNRAKTTKVL